MNYVSGLIFALCVSLALCVVLLVQLVRSRSRYRLALDESWRKLAAQAFDAEKRNRLTLRIGSIIGSNLDPGSVLPQIVDLLSRHFEKSELVLLKFRDSHNFSCIQANSSREEVVSFSGLADTLSRTGFIRIEAELARALKLNVSPGSTCYNVPIISGDKFAGTLLVCAAYELEAGDQRFLIDLVPSLTAALRNQSLTERFGRAVDYRVRDHLMSLSANAPGELRNAGILFVDLVGFTSQAERLSPASIVDFLNAFFSRCQTIISAHGGIINKFLGDGFMAIFNAPVADADFQERMLHAGYAIMNEREEFSALALTYGIRNFAIALGAESGSVLAGIIGSQDRLEYTLMGDVVNVASRLEGLTRFFGVSFLVGETLCSGVEQWKFRNLGRIRPKGKSDALTIFELIGPVNGDCGNEAERIAIFEEGLRLYQQKEFRKALQVWSACPSDCQDRALEWYRGQAEDYLRIPPPDDWDGSEVFRNK